MPSFALNPTVKVAVPLVAVTFILASYLHTRTARRKRALLNRIKALPGSWPLVGNIGWVKHAVQWAGRNPGKRHLVMAETIKHADPDQRIIRMNILGRDVVFSNNPAVHHALLRQGGWLPKNMVFYRALTMLGSRAPSIIMQEDPQEHARLRKHFNAFFTEENIESVYNTLLKNVVSVVDSAAMQAQAGGAAHAEIDMLELAHELIANVVLQVFFETEQKVDMDAFKDAIEHIGEVFDSPLKIKLLNMGLGGENARAKRNYNTLRDGWKNVDEYNMALSNVGLVYGAGSETTAMAISVTMAALSADPESMRKLEQELDNAGMLVSKDDPRPKLPSAAAMRDLPFLSAVVHESLRCFPPIAVAVGRSLDRDMPVPELDITIPQGTSVGFGIWPMHYDTALWGADAGEWRPERWREAKSIAAMKKDANGHMKWVPFTLGPQNCLGQHLALMEMRLAVAVLVSQMHVQLDHSKMAARTPADIIASVRSRLTMQLDGGVHLLMTPRAESV